jgi:Uma2 family endonuclease
MATTTQDTNSVCGEQCLVLPAVGWHQYETLLQAFPEQAGLRITYLDGRLTLVSPTRRHDRYEKVLGRLFETIAELAGIEIEVAGHATYRQQPKDAGVEGDQTYYVGANARQMRGSDNIDLSRQPPPDLVIEVEATHKADDSVAAWGRLGVTEVWRLNIEHWTLSFGKRRDDGSFEKVPRSLALPFVEPNDLLTQLQLAEELGWSPWVAQLDEWVRDVLLSRRGK